VYQLGVDVMKVKLPPRETYLGFIRTFTEQLTATEQRSLIGVGDEEGLRRFFWIWVMKEAYTKALGLGLGFDFRRIEYNVLEETVRIDGRAAEGWEFCKFEVPDPTGDYLLATAEHVGGSAPNAVRKAGEGFCDRLAADTFMNRAVQRLK